MAIDPSQPIPLYFQLKTLLLEEILGGHYGPDGRLPTEHELCAQYGISRTPVTRALSELAVEGVILRQRRRGTFVNPHWLRRSPGQAEVRVMLPDGPWARLVRNAAGEIKTSIVTMPREELHEALTHAVAHGQAPDLAFLDSIWMAELAAAGFLYALEELDDEWLEREYAVDFLEPLAAGSRHEGKTYGVPTSSDLAGLWYRRDELEALGLDPPATWDELRALGSAFAARGYARPIALPGGSRGGETTAYCLIALLASNGARVLGPAGVSLDSHETVEALTFLRELVQEGLLPIEVVGYEMTRATRLLAEGQTGISFGGSYEAPMLASALDISLEDVWERFGFVAAPAGPRGAPASTIGGWHCGIFRQAAQPRQAMRLIEKIVEPSSLARLARDTGRIPPRRAAIELALPDVPLLAERAQMLEHAVSRPSTPLYPRVSAQLQIMSEAVLTGRLSPSTAARRTAEMIGAITGLPVLDRESSVVEVAG